MQEMVEIEDVAVYGVEVEGEEGRPGMISMALREGADREVPIDGTFQINCIFRIFCPQFPPNSIQICRLLLSPYSSEFAPIFSGRALSN